MTSKKVLVLQQRHKEIQQELAALQKFRQTKQRDQFIQQLIGEQNYVRRQLFKALSSHKKHHPTKRERQRRQARANRQRSIKMKRSWEYFRSIQQNYFHDMSLREIRSKFSKHRDGLETDIPDVVWRNPSP